MTDLKGRIEELVSMNLGKESFFLVDVLLGGSPAMRKITVLVDGDQGISVEDCATISRKLAERLEQEDLIDSAYVLEVSSPGVDQPLKLKRQYLKNVGRKLAVTLGDQQIKSGKLVGVKEEGIVLDEEVKDKQGKGKKITIQTVEIPFDQIKKSNVLIAFN